MKESDKKIQDLIAKIEKDEIELAALGRKISPWRTNGSFSFNSKTFNIHTISDETVIIDAVANLLSKKNNLKEACDLLGLDAPVFKHEGFTFDDYLTDFKNRLLKITQSKQKAKLKTAKKRLEQLMSEDLRTAKELEEIERSLNE